MLPLVEILAAVVVLVWVIPLVWASASLNMDRLQSLGLASKHILLSLFSKESSFVKQLNAEYQSKEDSYIKCRHDFRSHVELDKQFRKQLDGAQQKLKSLQHRALKTPKRRGLKDRIAQTLKEIGCIEQQVKQNDEMLEALLQNLTDLESELQGAYTTKQIQIAKYYSDQALKRASQTLLRAKAQDGAIGKMERIVSERESRATAPRLAPITDVPKVSEADVAAIERLIDRTVRVVQYFQAIPAALDPSVERAYKRLCRELEIARVRSNRSLVEEDALEVQIEDCLTEIVCLQILIKTASEDGFQDRAKQLNCTKASFEESSAHLQLALQAHRKRNLIIGQRLFRIDGIVQRLRILKSLLNILPSSMHDEPLQYKNFVKALYKYMKKDWLGGSESLMVEGQVDFTSRLAMLESGIQMAFIRIAKGQFTPLSARAAVRFREQLSKATDALRSEQSDQRVELERWSNLTKQALVDQKELLYGFASQRNEQVAVTLRTIERSLDVLTVTMSVWNQANGRSDPSFDQQAG